MARIPAFQAGRVGSIPITRSKRKVAVKRLFCFLKITEIEPAVRSLAVPVVAALPLATADRGASFCSLYHPQDALATSPITRSIRGVVIVMRNYF